MLAVSVGFHLDVIPAGADRGTPDISGYVKDEGKVAVFISRGAFGYRQVHPGEAESCNISADGEVGSGDSDLITCLAHIGVKDDFGEVEKVHIVFGHAHIGHHGIPIPVHEVRGRLDIEVQRYAELRICLRRYMFIEYLVAVAIYPPNDGYHVVAGISTF